LFDTVPEPMMLPARTLRVLHRCEISWGKLNTMSTPACGCPTSLPFQVERSGRCTLPPFHASPNSSGVTATGEKLIAGFDCRKPDPFASSGGIRLRSETSFTGISSLICW